MKQSDKFYCSAVLGVLVLGRARRAQTLAGALVGRRLVLLAQPALARAVRHGAVSAAVQRARELVTRPAGMLDEAQLAAQEDKARQRELTRRARSRQSRWLCAQLRAQPRSPSGGASVSCVLRTHRQPKLGCLRRTHLQ